MVDKAHVIWNASELLLHAEVKAVADNVELEYRGSSPEKLSDSVYIWDVCIRPRPCHDFSGCLPAYKYRTKQHGTGSSMEDCCEPLLCKDALKDGCSPDTKWQPSEDFDAQKHLKVI